MTDTQRQRLVEENARWLCVRKKKAKERRERFVDKETVQRQLLIDKHARENEEVPLRAKEMLLADMTLTQVADKLHQNRLELIKRILKEEVLNL